MADMPMVVLNGVHKQYGRGAVGAEDVSLTVDVGEMVALFGPSGSGKTSILHIIGLLQSADSGEVWLAGDRVDRISESSAAAIRRETLGFVFQSFGLLPLLSATENVVTGVPSGVYRICNFTVAVNAKLSKARVESCPTGWKDGWAPEGQESKHWEKVKFYRVTTWRGLAETCNSYLEKGRQVLVEGEMAGELSDGVESPRVWTGNDGEARASFELTARTVKFLGGRNGNGGGGAPVGEPPPQGFEEDALPF